MRVSKLHLQNKKYTIVFDKTGVVTDVLRYGQPWPVALLSTDVSLADNREPLEKDWEYEYEND